MAEEGKRPELSRQRSVKFTLADACQGPSFESNFESSVTSDDELDISKSSNSFSSRFRVMKVEGSTSAERRPSCGSRKGSDDGSVGGGARRPSTFETYFEANKTFGRNTLESLPHIDHYRNLFTTGAMRQRPTLMELHEQEELDKVLQEEQTNRNNNDFAIAETKKSSQALVKFGWIKGVFVRCVLNIFGVMLFLRLPWVVAQAGIGFSTVVILLAGVVTTLTALSMSTICTNGEVKGGGAYYLISRSLGPEFGGAIGVVFSIANAVAAAMYIVGFAETIRDILKSHDLLMVDEANDVRIIGLITAFFILAVAVAGLSWEARAQLVLLAILLMAIADFVIGTFMPASEKQQERGFYGYQVQIFKENFVPDFRSGHSFFSVFGIFFPAATGILAGANISGDLRDAQTAIPKGTLLAILVTTITYLVLAWMAGACVVRDAAGRVIESPLVTAMGNFSNFTLNATGDETMFQTAAFPYYAVDENLTAFASYAFDFNSTVTTIDNRTNATKPCLPGRCKYGMHNDMQVMQLVSLFGPVTIAGIISATLSSALASLVSAPRIFQAVCKDKIFPYIHVFAKGYGDNDEPRRAYALTFCICIACIAIGDLNAIAPLISNFFLMSYLLINYSCVDASLSKSPGWRPSYRFYSLWLSLVGALLCLIVMFIINWWTALLTIAVMAILYFYVHYHKPDINWGSSTQAHVYRNALQYSQRLTMILEHVKNYRPQILALTGFPGDRPAMVDFCASITKNISLMVCGQVIIGDPLDKLRSVQPISKMAYAWLGQKKSKSFHCIMMSESLRTGVQALMQSVGIGKLKPNTLIMGFKSDWQTCAKHEVQDYFGLIHDAFDLRYSIGILRLKEGLHVSNSCQNLVAGSGDSDVPQSLAGDGEAASFKSLGQLASPMSDVTILTDLATPTAEAATPTLLSVSPQVEKRGGTNTRDVECGPLEEGLANTVDSPDSDDDEGDDEDALEEKELSKVNQENLLHRRMSRKSTNRFSHKQKKGFIDVWWLFDDGGLTLLVPYLMTTKKMWKNCKLRVFMAGTKKDAFNKDHRHVALLLHKFRIQYASITVVTDICKRPKPESMKEFEDMIKDWTVNKEDSETEETCPWMITTNELATQKSKTFRHVRLRELLREHSSEATLIVMTLPMPKKGLCSAGLFMAWLDILTKDMPPILLLRGNQENVLTYYS